MAAVAVAAVAAREDLAAAAVAEPAPAADSFIAALEDRFMAAVPQVHPVEGVASDSLPEMVATARTVDLAELAEALWRLWPLAASSAGRWIFLLAEVMVRRAKSHKTVAPLAENRTADKQEGPALAFLPVATVVRVELAVLEVEAAMAVMVEPAAAVREGRSSCLELRSKWLD